MAFGTEHIPFKIEHIFLQTEQIHSQSSKCEGNQAYPIGLEQIKIVNVFR
jgi:hypothetical protein